jgi:hypothetical protein
MNNNQTQRNLLVDTLNVGVIYQLLHLLVEQAFVLGKTDTVRALMEVFQKFEASLSEEEKQHVKQMIEKLTDEKMQQVTQELEKNLTPEELKEVINSLPQPMAH